MATDLIQDGQQEGPAMVKVEEDPFYVQETDLQLNSQSSQIFHQRFRLFPYQETPGPREALRRLRELGRQWLSPETHSKEQILGLPVLEQLVTVLPAELQAWVRGQHPESGDEVVTVLEDLERLLDEPGEQGTFQADGQEVLWEEVTSLGAGCLSPCDQPQHVETTPPA